MAVISFLAAIAAIYLTMSVCQSQRDIKTKSLVIFRLNQNYENTSQTNFFKKGPRGGGAIVCCSNPNIFVSKGAHEKFQYPMTTCSGRIVMVGEEIQMAMRTVIKGKNWNPNIFVN